MTFWQTLGPSLPSVSNHRCFSRTLAGTVQELQSSRWRQVARFVRLRASRFGGTAFALLRLGYPQLSLTGLAQPKPPKAAKAGGGRGIRTPGAVSRTAVFKTACFNHSHIPPRRATSNFKLRTPEPVLRGPSPAYFCVSSGTSPVLDTRTSDPSSEALQPPAGTGILSVPMYGLSAAGMTTDPSSCWQFSRIAISVRPTASPDPFSVCANCALPVPSGR
jgi:hypothetical protein